MAEVASVLADVATALGIPIAIVAFIVERRRDRRDRELDTYRTVSLKYFEYLRVVLEHPDLSTTETEWSKAGDAEKSPKQDLLVQMAVNMVETAFYLYRGHRSSFRRAQWLGWEEYLQDWCTHPAFVAKWPGIVAQYDNEFGTCVRRVYEQVHGDTAAR